MPPHSDSRDHEDGYEVQADHQEVDYVDKGIVLDWTFRGLLSVLTVLVGVIAWQGREALNSISDHEKRLTTIESSRFTKDDGAAMQKEITSISRDLAVQSQASAETERRLERIEDKLDMLIDRVSP